MIGYCFDGGLNGFFLMTTRLSIVVVSIYGLRQIWKLRSFQRKNKPAVRLIPTPLVFAAMGWLWAQLFVTLYLLTTPCTTELSAFTRTLYGNSLVWAQATTMVIVAHGLRYRIKVYEQMQSAPLQQITREVVDEAIKRTNESRLTEDTG